MTDDEIRTKVDFHRYEKVSNAIKEIDDILALLKKRIDHIITDAFDDGVSTGIDLGKRRAENRNEEELK